MNKGFEVVFSDDYLLVVVKKAKLLIQPSPKKEKNTLTSLLRKELKKQVFACHRLDRETSGLIIYAKDSKIQNKLMREFREGRVKKRYIAFIKGKMRKKRGLLKGFILDKDGERFGEKPKMAETFYNVDKEFRDFSILSLEPKTGRTNQIRIQLAQTGHPILGERKYAFGRDFKVKFRRLALHACFLSFTHPIHKRTIKLSIGLPPDMESFLMNPAL